MFILKLYSTFEKEEGIDERILKLNILCENRIYKAVDSISLK